MSSSPPSNRRRGSTHLIPSDATPPASSALEGEIVERSEAWGKDAPAPLVRADNALPAAYQQAMQLVLDSVDSPHTHRAYQRALVDFLTWHAAQGCPPLTRATVQAYRSTLVQAGTGAASINQRLTAIRKLAREALDNHLLDPAQLAGIERVASIKRHGRRSGNWLTREEAQALLTLPDTTMLKGVRDRALLAVMLACGLRRSEVVALTFAHIQERSGRWVILDLVGKHQRVRTVPMAQWCKQAIDEWVAQAGFPITPEGHLFRRLNKGGRVTGATMVPQAIHNMVGEYGALLGKPTLAPHDLRRTFARLARDGGAELDQIKESLGHASVQTTEHYVGAMQSLTDAPTDRIGLHLP